MANYREKDAPRDKDYHDDLSIDPHDLEKLALHASKGPQLPKGATLEHMHEGRQFQDP